MVRISTAEVVDVFLSTPSARRATVLQDVLNRAYKISIHALREEGDGDLLARKSKISISIHALREEGDQRLILRILRRFIFLSTPSARRATGAGCRPVRCPEISIHALREEGDKMRRTKTMANLNFYPRPPRGGRRTRHIAVMLLSKISIHALREEGDCVQQK